MKVVGLRLLLIRAALVGFAAAAAQMPSTAQKQERAFLVYLDEFSAYLSNEAKTIIADAAKRSADWALAGSPLRRGPVPPGGLIQVNTSRSPIVADQLEADGIARARIRQQTIG